MLSTIGVFRWNLICTYLNCSFEAIYLLSPHKCPCIVLVVHAMVLSVTDLSGLNSHYYLYAMSGFPHSKFWYPSMHSFFHLGFDPVICIWLLKNQYRLSTYKLNRASLLGTLFCDNVTCLFCSVFDILIHIISNEQKIFRHGTMLLHRKLHEP